MKCLVVKNTTMYYNYSMNKVINIKNKKAIKEIRQLGDKLLSNSDVKFENVHLRRLNEIMAYDVFSKNDLYINSVTLWELMQPLGQAGSHNYHGLIAEDIYAAVNAIETPYCIFKIKYGRYAVVPVYISSCNNPIMIVIEIGAGLVANKNANINKIVTMYPKSDIDNLLKKLDEKDILFKKK